MSDQLERVVPSDSAPTAAEQRVANAEAAPPVVTPGSTEPMRAPHAPGAGNHASGVSGPAADSDSEGSDTDGDALKRKPGPDGGPQLSDVWVFNGRAYDLTDWISKHPGGEFFIGRTKNRDITSIVGSYHLNPDRVARSLERYAVGRDAVLEDVHPKNNAPDFLFTPGFDSWRDTPKYGFGGQTDLLARIKARIKEPALAARLKRADRIFNIVVAVLFVLYIGVQAVRLTLPAWMPLPAFVIAMVVLRSSMAAFGHYSIHRAQNGMNKVYTNAFDMNYVALAFVTADGHALLHHPHTQSEVDIKKNVFTFMMDLPRGFRIPIHTLHKFGHLLTGMTIRMFEICQLTRKVGLKDMYGSVGGALPHFFGAFGMRFVLLAEFIIFLLAGDVWAWVLQFVITLWISTFLVVASHDFEIETEELPVNREDWAINQIEQAYDLKVIGNRYVDCFLSAGLSSHRVHHVLPFQRSGFANILTEDVVREEAAKFGVEWEKSKSFVTDRFPKQVATYLLAPSRHAQENQLGFVKEHFSPTALKTCAKYTVQGFTGIGTV